ncbi:hypothetical protein OIV83_003614 [Microbotryomycetes sp. JL201]|nr:hypothetical protein OIV83_003614 [Microbotryomycetes sp. JL201]
MDRHTNAATTHSAQSGSSSFFAAPFKLQDADDASATTVTGWPYASRLGTPSGPAAASTSTATHVQWRASSVPALHALSSRQREKQPMTRQQELERSHKAARLASTLRLKAAWSDIAYRHSHTATGPLQPHRLRRGTTRALLEDDDDIVDLETMEIVQDRGVLRNARQDAFQIGGLDDDSGNGRDKRNIRRSSSGAFSGGVDDRESAGCRTRDRRPRDEADETWFSDECDNDDEQESEDELAAIDELPSLPSVVYRAQRMEAEERRLDLLEFTRLETEARAFRASTGALGTDGEDIDDEEWERTAKALEMAIGNEVLDARHLPVVAEEDENDELAVFEVTPNMCKPVGHSTTAEHVVGERPAPPSTLKSLRKRFGSVQLERATPPNHQPRRFTRSQSVIIEESPSSVLPASRSMPSLGSQAQKDSRVHRDETPLSFRRHSFTLNVTVPLSRGKTPMPPTQARHSLAKPSAAAKYPTPPAQPASSSPLKRTHRPVSVASDSEDELAGGVGSRRNTTAAIKTIDPVRPMPSAASLATPPNSKVSVSSDQPHDAVPSPTKRRRSFPSAPLQPRQRATPPVSRGSDGVKYTVTPALRLDTDEDELLLEPVDTPVKLEVGMIEKLWPDDVSVAAAAYADDIKPAVDGQVQRRRSDRAGSVLNLLPSPPKPQLSTSATLLSVNEEVDELDLFSSA